MRPFIMKVCMHVAVLLLVAGTCCLTCCSAAPDFPHPQDGGERASDDISALQTTVDRHATLIEDLQAKQTALDAEVKAVKSRQQALSLAVGFTVRFSSDSPHGIPLGRHSTLIFDDVLTNLGHGYDPATGIFTAPVGGLYTFFLTIMSANRHVPLFVDIVKPGVLLDKVFAEGSRDNYDQGSTQVSTYLKSGEQVWVSKAAGDAVRGGTWTVFTGYLIQAE